MPYQSTPGRWLQYVSNSIGPGQTQQVFAVPQGYQFRLSYLILATFNAISAGTLYVACDGVPIETLGPGQLSIRDIFTTPFVMSQTMFVGSFGTLDGLKSYVLSYDGQMVKYGT